MKNFVLLVILGIIISCSTLKKPFSSLTEEELIHTRKYIGSFVDCYSTGPEVYGGANLIWIRTTLHENYDQLSVYGKDCEFFPGDKIYLRSTYSTSGSFGNWEYLVENESSVAYRVSEYRFEDKVLVQNIYK